MKIRHLENTRLVLLAAYIAAKVFVNNDDTLFSEVNNYLLSNGIAMEDITPFMSMVTNFSVLTGFSLEQFCSDYESMDKYYRFVVNNTAELVEAFGIEDDPVKIFALYTYMYRSGYLSVDKEFKYSIDMKDIPIINGVDVVRGRGVCRSISSMFTDVCNSVGLSACNVSVRVKPSTMKQKEGLSLRGLDSELRGKKYANVVGQVTSILPVGNHLVTAIEHDSHSGIYDPTNDIFMHVVGTRKYEFINDTSATMSYSFISNLAPKLLGQMDTQPNIAYLRRLSMKDRISYEEYSTIYEEMNELIKEKEDIFELFYKLNLPYYRKLCRLANEQHGMLKRILPIIPEIRRK